LEKKVLVLEKELVEAKVQMLEMEKKLLGINKTHIPERTKPLRYNRKRFGPWRRAIQKGTMPRWEVYQVGLVNFI